MVPRVTQKSIAARLGVSVTLVSRCLNGTASSIGVSPATIERIKEAAMEMGYVPNSAARSLRGAPTRTLGVVVWDFMDPFLGAVAGTLQGLAHNEGYSLLLCGFLRREFSARDLLPLKKTGIDGLIIVGSDKRLGWAKPFLEQHLPVVRIGTGEVPNGMVSIGIDESRGFSDMVEVLWRQGHRQVIFVGACHSTHVRRLDLFLRAAGAVGLAVHSVQGPEALGLSAEAGKVALRELLEGPCRRFSAVIGANDLVAMGAWSALHEAGLKVPEDVSLVGFDDIPSSSLCVPGLTTVQQNVHELSSAAFRAVVAGARPGPQLIKPTFIERGTVRAVNPT